MKYIIIGILIFIFLILIICYFIRKKYAIKKVKCTSDEEKLSMINAALEPFGFKFDRNQDIVISKKDAWQKNFGYMDLYDRKAPFFNMVMDSFPLLFDYDCKHYRIEFWKGQYGLTTGAEIGIYIKDEYSHTKNYYRSATKEEELKMTFQLIKHCKLFEKVDKTWWLTGFDVGIFSKPKDLKMRICIELKNKEMTDIFVNALINAGYSKGNIEICDNIVCFDYCVPPYYKPNKKHKIIKCIAQIFNFINCHIYMYFTRYFNRTLDKLTYIRYMFPCLYSLIIKLCVPHRKEKCYHKK